MPIPKTLTVRAKALRKDATPSERLLWSRLRQKRFCGLKFRRQQPIGPYIVDFFCPVARLVIELDGESHVGKEGHDKDRQTYLEQQGLKVMRFWDNDLFGKTNAVLELIYQHCLPAIAVLPTREVPRGSPSPCGRGKGRADSLATGYEIPLGRSRMP